jgi:hypothetical protein
MFLLKEKKKPYFKHTCVSVCVHYFKILISPNYYGFEVDFKDLAVLMMLLLLWIIFKIGNRRKQVLLIII